MIHEDSLMKQFVFEEKKRFEMERLEMEKLR
jgi:hypothetical protein